MPKPEEYLKAPYARVLIPNEDGSFSAEILELTGCFAQGDTADEALKNLDKAALEWIEAAIRQGREIPEPSSTRGYSGTISLRIPKGLHRQVTRMAERDGVSMNQYLVTAISARVGADDLFNRTAQRLTGFTVHFASHIECYNTTFNIAGVQAPSFNILNVPVQGFSTNILSSGTVSTLSMVEAHSGRS